MRFSLFLNSAKMASTVALYLHENRCSSLERIVSSLNLRGILLSMYIFSLAMHLVICMRCLVSLWRARYCEPRQGETDIRPTCAKSAMTKELIPSVLSNALKDSLYFAVSLGFRQKTCIENGARMLLAER